MILQRLRGGREPGTNVNANGSTKRAQSLRSEMVMPWPCAAVAMARVAAPIMDAMASYGESGVVFDWKRFTMVAGNSSEACVATKTNMPVERWVDR